MNVSFITTVRHNIGDDFVREGIKYLLSELLGDFCSYDIHKHSPISVVLGAEFIRSNRVSKLLDPVARFVGLEDKINKADLLIQCGAPVYWCHSGGPHCFGNEWYDPLIRQRLQKRGDHIPFLNIAGGSCQRYHSSGNEVLNCEGCRAYMAEFFDACDLTLLRDSLAKKMLNYADRDADVLPCTSIFAKDRLGIAQNQGEYIVVNFMENAGHYTFGQNIDSAKWRRNFVKIVDSLSGLGRVVASCHNADEKRLVSDLCPGLDAYIVPDDFKSFIEFYSRARFGVVNRVHAGFMMASFGRPVAVVGNDSRALMVENLDLDSYYVDDVDEQVVDKIVTGLVSAENGYADVIDQIRAKTKKAYLNRLSQVVSR